MGVLVKGSAVFRVPVPSTEVWQNMRRFGEVGWTEGIAEVVLEGDGVGMLRKVRLEGSDDWIHERLTAMDEKTMSFDYILEGDGMPGLEEYCARGQLSPGPVRI